MDWTPEDEAEYLRMGERLAAQQAEWDRKDSYLPQCQGYADRDLIRDTELFFALEQENELQLRDEMWEGRGLR